MSSFKDFATSLSVEIHGRYEGIELDITGINAELPEYRLIGGCNGREILYTGIFIIKGDGLDILQIKKQMELISTLLKDKKLPEKFLNIYMFYVYEQGCPEELEGKNLNDNNLPGMENIEFNINRVFYAGSADLLNSTVSSTKYGAVFLESLKNSLINVKSGIVPCEDYIEEHKNKYYDFKLRLEQNRPVATWLIMATCISMFLWMTFSGGSENHYTLLRFGANYGPLVKAGEWWRLTGSMFLHIGIVHLLVNMFTLLSIGSTLEKYFGTLRYMALYALAGIGGSLASAFTRDILAAGASGALFGLCGSAACLGFRYRKEIPATLRNQLAGGMISCIVYNLLYGFIASGIDNSAHIGGLVVGIIYAMIVSPPVLKGKEKESLNIYLLLFLFTGIIPFIAQFYISYRAVYKTGFENYPLREYRDETGKDIILKYPALLTPKEYKEGKGLAGPGMFVQPGSFEAESNLDIRTARDTLLAALEKNGMKVKDHKFTSVNGREWLICNMDNMEKNVTYYLLFTCYGKKLFRIEIMVLDRYVLQGEEMKNMIMKNFLPGK